MALFSSIIVISMSTDYEYLAAQEQEASIITWLENTLQAFLATCVAESALSSNTLAAYENDLRAFGEFATGLKLKDVESVLTKTVLRQYFSKLYNDKVQRSTFLRKFSSLNRFCNFLLSEQQLDKNPMVSMRRPHREMKLPRFLQEDEVSALVKQARLEGGRINLRLACIVEMLYSTGLRVSELIQVKVKDIMDKEKSIDRFIKIVGKGNKERLVPLRDSTRDLLQEYLVLRHKFLNREIDSGYLFASRGRRGHLTREQIGMALKKLALKTGMAPSVISPHILRHSFATRLCNQKIDLRVLQQLLGHADISTTEIYIEVLDREIVDFVNQHHILGDAQNE